MGLRWLSPSGRVGRGTYIVTLIVLILIGMVAVRGLDATLGKPFGTAAVALSVWIGIGVSGRRLHDTGRSAWWLLVFAVPVIGALWLAWVLLFQRGTPGDNRYGTDPQQRAADYLTVA